MHAIIHLMLQIAAVCSWIVLILFSVIPAKRRPHADAWPIIAHALAYFLAASVTRFSFQDTRSRWQVVAFSVAAALFATRQIRFSGRSAALRNWVAGTGGALLGVILVKWLLEGTIL